MIHNDWALLYDSIVLTSANWPFFSTKIILEGLSYGFRYDKKGFNMENECVIGKVYVDCYADLFIGKISLTK